MKMPTSVSWHLNTALYSRSISRNNSLCQHIFFTGAGIQSTLIGQWIRWDKPLIYPLILLTTNMSNTLFLIISLFFVFITQCVWGQGRFLLIQIWESWCYWLQAIGQCSLCSFSQCFWLINIKSALHNPYDVVNPSQVTLQIIAACCSSPHSVLVAWAALHCVR